MKKKTKKFLTGGKVNNYIQDPGSELTQLQINMAKSHQEVNNDPFLNGLNVLGSMSGNILGAFDYGEQGVGDMTTIPGAQVERVATGGTTGRQVEIERGEVLEKPDGTLLDFSEFGKSHAKGGIKLSEEDAPPGSEVHSAKVKIGGKSMADIKLAYEKKASKLDKLLASNPTDRNLKKTKELFDQGYAKVNERNMLIQNMLKEANNYMASGGTVDDLEEDELYDLEEYASQNDMTPEEAYEELYGDSEEDEEEEVMDEEDIEEGYEDDMEMELEEEEEDEEYATGGTKDGYPRKPKTIFDKVANSYLFNADPLTKEILDPSEYPQAYAPAYDPTAEVDPISTGLEPEEDKSFMDKILRGFSGGDLLGIAGTAYGAVTGRNNTEANRAGDKPNINPFLGYGDEAMKTMDKAGEGLDFSRDESMKNLQLNRNAALSRGRNGARSINTSRALDLATDASITAQEGKVLSAHASQVSQLMQGKARMKLDQDTKVMTGKQLKDMNDRRDRDNYYTNKGADAQSLATGMQQLAKQFNEPIERGMKADLISSMSDYFGVDISADGITFGNKKEPKAKNTNSKAKENFFNKLFKKNK